MSEIPGQLPLDDAFLTTDPTAIEGRELRVATRLDLPVPRMPLRGKKRERAPGVTTEHPPKNPIREENITRLGKRLATYPKPLMDDITGFVNPLPGNIARYALKGTVPAEVWRSLTPDQKLARERQQQHIADKTQRKFRTSLDSFTLYREALQSIRNSTDKGRPVNPTAAFYASGAVEAFGICLRDYRPLVREAGITAETLPTAIEHIGVYTSENPEALTDYPLVLKLVQHEAAKGVRFYGAGLNTLIAEDRDRATQADHEAHQNYMTLIAEIRADAAAA